MAAQTVALKTGEKLTIRVAEPPFPEYTGKVGCWWSAVRDELFAGELKPWLYTPYVVGELDGQVVGYISYWTPTDTRDVGLVEFVSTAEGHRRKGIASALMTRLIEHFQSGGGLALYLCTTNPQAGGLYEKSGFWYHIGDGMRYLATEAGDFDATYLSFCGEACARLSTWADLPRAAALFNHPEPRWLIKDYMTQTFRHTRYESHFMALRKRLENGRGACVVLENPNRRVVGLASFERLDTHQEQHVANLSFRVCPAYTSQTNELLDAAADQARELSIGILQIHVADPDLDQKELAESCGFEEEARLRNRLRDGERSVDLLVYTRVLEDAPTPLREEGDYYGGRKAWQAERVAVETV
ncbi:MAG: GNAT family N-acetyltransferase [Candidatus Latescibacteria bacterium]|jgi:GNAT superfamily N-acetyltransferase/RimJ/RimL family protein N-acetyltransferase|nr:GNAT family N-acetyltransferase [Candidatus Latescibacterota bacterium]